MIVKNAERKKNEWQFFVNAMRISMRIHRFLFPHIFTIFAWLTFLRRFGSATPAYDRRTCDITRLYLCWFYMREEDEENQRKLKLPPQRLYSVQTRSWKQKAKIGYKMFCWNFWNIFTFWSKCNY
jgi:hypothetical protein